MTPRGQKCPKKDSCTVPARFDLRRISSLRLCDSVRLKICRKGFVLRTGQIDSEAFREQRGALHDKAIPQTRKTAGVSMAAEWL